MSQSDRFRRIAGTYELPQPLDIARRISKERKDGVKWIDGVRYVVRKPYFGSQSGVWIQCQIENTNPFPQDVIIHILGFLPIYWIYASCSWVCKDWNRAFKSINDRFWVSKLRREFKITLPNTVHPTARNYVMRKCRAVQLLKTSLEGSVDCIADLISCGFPCNNGRRIEPRINAIGCSYISNLRKKEVQPRPSVGDISFWGFAYNIAYNLGPFTEEEYSECDTNTETWRYYVEKLLFLSDYRNSKNYSEPEKWTHERHLTASSLKLRNRSRFIVSLSIFLNEKYQANIFLSEEMQLIVEKGKDALIMHEYNQSRKKSRENDIAFKRKIESLNIENHDLQKESLTVENIIARFQLGFYIDIMKLTTNSPWDISMKSEFLRPGAFCVTLISPIYVESTTKKNEVVQKRSIKVSVLQDGTGMIIGCKTMKLVNRVYEESKVMLIPFKLHKSLDSSKKNKI